MQGFEFDIALPNLRVAIKSARLPGGQVSVKDRPRCVPEQVLRGLAASEWKVIVFYGNLRQIRDVDVDHVLLLVDTRKLLAPCHVVIGRC